MRYKILFSLLFLISMSRAALTAEQDEYLSLGGSINGLPVHFCFDTGAEISCLFSPGAKRLSLTVIQMPEIGTPYPGKVPFDISEKVTFSMDGFDNEIEISFPVFELPAEASYTHLDGLIGWNQIKHNILQIDADSKSITGLKQLPSDMDTWSKWMIFPCEKFEILMIRTPDTENQEGIIVIDTGSPNGIALNRRRWGEVSSRQQGSPFTLMAYYTPAVGLKIYEERWVDHLEIGSFRIVDMPVHEEDEIFEQAFPNLQACIGLFALTKFEVVIDGPGGYVYMRPKANPVTTYQHNRLAAVFIPQLPHSAALTAHVLDDGPADNAGIRNGDILLKIGELDVTKWQTDPAVLPLSRFWEQPAGTKLELTLTRNGQAFSKTVELKDLLPLKPVNPSRPETHERIEKD